MKNDEENVRRKGRAVAVDPAGGETVALHTPGCSCPWLSAPWPEHPPPSSYWCALPLFPILSLCSRFFVAYFFICQGHNITKMGKGKLSVDGGDNLLLPFMIRPSENSADRRVSRATGSSFRESTHISSDLKKKQKSRRYRVAASGLSRKTGWGA